MSETNTQRRPKEITLQLDDADAPFDFTVPLDGDTLHARERRPGPQVDDDADADADADQGTLDSATDTDEERETKARRRRSRRTRDREARDQDRALIESLQLQVQDLAASLGQVQGASTQSQVAIVDTELQRTQAMLTQARQAHAAAVERADGAAAVQASDLAADLRDRFRQLQGIRQRVAQAPAQQQRGTDPRLMNHADAWLRRNPWYDPDLTDEDSRHASVVDEVLGREGFDPRTPAFWAELDRRLSRVLPHRYGKTPARDTTTQEDDEPVPIPRERTPPLVGGSGRERPGQNGDGGARRPPNPGTYRLSAERVAAAQEAGIWGDKKRMANFVRQCIVTDQKLKAEARR